MEFNFEITAATTIIANSNTFDLHLQLAD